MLYVVITKQHSTVQYSTVQYSTGGGDMLYVVITKLGHGSSEAAPVSGEDESGNL